MISSEDYEYADFAEKSIRMGFIRKVFSILLLQLAFTIGVVAFFIFYIPAKEWVMENHWIVWVMFGITLFIMLAAACIQSVRRTFPCNMIVLSIFTLAESVLVGVISSRYNIYHVLLALSITAVVSLALIFFALQTKIDFTLCNTFLFVALIILMIFGIVCIFVYNRIMLLVYSSLGALIFCLYLVMDVQLMMGGKHKYSISPEEYMFAALNIYIDIIQIFIMLLMIISGASD